MFHSGSSSNGIQDSYNTFNENPSSSRQAIVHSSPFMHFPTSFLDEDDEMLVVRWLSQNEQQKEGLMGSSSLAETEGSFVAAKEGSFSAKRDDSKSNINAEAYDQQRPPKEADKKKSAKQSALRKRSGKKDRHSKIYTAQGPRDRRMRLSLQIARKFFNLQDMLGFDKASKTIEWLLTRSKSAINELTKNVQQENPRKSNGAKSMSSTSENEVVSGIKKCDTAHNTDQGFIVGVGESSSPVAKPKEKKGRIKTRKAAPSPIAKESRNKARARARERAMRNKCIQVQEDSKKSSGPNPSNYLEQKLDGNMDSNNQENNSAVTSVVNEKDSNSIQLVVAEADLWIDSLSMTENFFGFTGAISTFPSSSEASTYPSFPALSGTNFKGAFPGNLEIDKAGILNNYHAISNLKHPVTGNMLIHFPTAPSSITSQSVYLPCVQGHNTPAERHIPRTIFRTEDQNPGLFFQEHNGSPGFTSAPDVYLQSLLQKDQFFCIPTSTSRNDSLA